MRSFAVLASGVLAAIAIGVGAEAAQPVASSAVVATKHVATVRVPPGGPCPKAITGDADVANPASRKLAVQLLPTGAVGGRICRYQGGSGGVVLRRQATFNSVSAKRFETLIARLSTRRPSGVYACPAGFPGATILAFGYPNGGYVDLWYADSGCQTLDNGTLRAYDVSGATAFAAFAARVNLLAPEAAPR